LAAIGSASIPNSALVSMITILQVTPFIHRFFFFFFLLLKLSLVIVFFFLWLPAPLH